MLPEAAQSLEFGADDGLEAVLDLSGLGSIVLTGTEKRRAEAKRHGVSELEHYFPLWLTCLNPKLKGRSTGLNSEKLRDSLASRPRPDPFLHHLGHRVPMGTGAGQGI